MVIMVTLRKCFLLSAKRVLSFVSFHSVLPDGEVSASVSLFDRRGNEMESSFIIEEFMMTLASSAPYNCVDLGRLFGLVLKLKWA